MQLSTPLPTDFVERRHRAEWTNWVFLRTQTELDIGARHGAGVPHFGVEIELELEDANEELVRRESAAQEFVGNVGTDCSLHHGLEIRTEPMSFAWFKGHEGAVKKFLSFLRNEGCAAYDPGTAGGHIHVSRDAFVGDHLYRFFDFILCNSRMTRTISQRTNTQLNEWANLFDSRMSIKRRRDIIKRSLEPTDTEWGPYGPDDVSAVCLRQNSVEMRFFRGTLRTRSFLKNVEFSHAAFMFSREANESERKPEPFREYVEAYKEFYPNLLNFMNTRHIGATTNEPLLPV